MNKEIQKQWIEALRSGQFHQGQESLFEPGHERYEEDSDGNVIDTGEYVPDSFCCLGVLCEIVEPEWKSYIYDMQSTDLAPAVESKSALDDVEIREMLAELNDNGYSFEQIAVVIEETDLRDNDLKEVKNELVYLIKNGEELSSLEVKEIIHAVIGGF